MGLFYSGYWDKEHDNKYNYKGEMWFGIPDSTTKLIDVATELKRERQLNLAEDKIVEMLYKEIKYQGVSNVWSLNNGFNINSTLQRNDRINIGVLQSEGGQSSQAAYGLYLNVTPIINDLFWRSVSLSLKMDEREWEKAVGSHGMFDYKNHTHPFDRQKGKSQFFYYNDYNLSSYVGAGHPTMLLRYDDPGNINYAITAKARGNMQTHVNPSSLLTGLPESYTKPYTPDVAVPKIQEAEKKDYKGNNIIDRFRFTKEGNAAVWFLQQTTTGEQIMAEVFSRFMSKKHEWDDLHDQAVIRWACDNSSRFISD